MKIILSIVAASLMSSAAFASTINGAPFTYTQAQANCPSSVAFHVRNHKVPNSVGYFNGLSPKSVSFQSRNSTGSKYMQHPATDKSLKLYDNKSFGGYGYQSGNRTVCFYQYNGIFTKGIIMNMVSQ